MNTVKVETLRHREAFDFFYILGYERSISKVANQFGVSFTSARKWSESFSWKDRVQKRDGELADAMDEQSKQDTLRLRTKIKDVIGSVIDRSVVEIDGKLIPTFHIEGVQDFERAVRLFQLLNGEPTDRRELIGNIDARAVIIAKLDRYQRLPEGTNDA